MCFKQCRVFGHLRLSVNACHIQRAAAAKYWKYVYIYNYNNNNNNILYYIYIHLVIESTKITPGKEYFTL